MSDLFNKNTGSNKRTGTTVNPFNNDISLSNVSNVTNMYQMFDQTYFQFAISKWSANNVSNVAKFALLSPTLREEHPLCYGNNSITIANDMIMYKKIFPTVASGTPWSDACDH